jgi:hypothetical protein
MRIGFVISVVVFFVAVGPILLDQWIAGYVDTRFILGTAAFSAGLCVGLFAIIATLGLAISILMKDQS